MVKLSKKQLKDEFCGIFSEEELNETLAILLKEKIVTENKKDEYVLNELKVQRIFNEQNKN